MEFDYFQYGNPIYHKSDRDTDFSFYGDLELKERKIYKVKVRPKMIYLIELFYYEELTFIKFYPKIHENNPNRYKVCDIGLSNSEKRKLLNTCCSIVHDEIEKDKERLFAFVAQIYDRDNEKKREISVRFSIYRKQVTTFFKLENYSHLMIKDFNFYCMAKASNKSFSKKIEAFITKAKKQESLVMEFITDRGRENIINRNIY